MKDENNLIESLGEPINLTNTEPVSLNAPSNVETKEIESLDGPVDSLELLENETVDMLDAPVNNALPNVSMILPAEQDIKNNDDSVYVKPKKKGKAKKLIVIVFLLLLLVIGGFAFYVYFMQTPKKAYDKFIDTIFESLKQEENIDKILMEGNLYVDTNIESAEYIKKYEANYKIGADYSNKQMEMYLGLKQDNNKIIEGTLYLLNQKIYLNSSDLYNNILYLTEYTEDFGNILSSDEQNYIITKLKTYIKNNLQDDYFTREFLIRDKKLVIANQFIINSSNFKKIVTGLINNIKNDEKMVSILAKNSNVTEEEYQENLNLLLQEDYALTKEIKINFYTNLFTSKLQEITIFVDDELIGKYIDNTFTMNIDVFKFTFTKSSNNYNFVLSNEENSTSQIMSFSLNYNEQSNKINFVLKLSEYDYDKTTDDTIAIYIDSQITYNQELTKVDISKAKDFNTLSDDELAIIIDNFNEKTKDTIFEDFSSLIFSSPDYSEDDYYYEDDTNEIIDFEEDQNCEYATCDACSDEYCNCVYYDNSFNEHNIKCYNKSYY